MAQKEQEVKVNVVAQVVPATVPFKNTTVGKTVRTFLQSSTAVLATVLPVVVASDDFRALVLKSAWAAAILGILPVVTGLVTFLQNYLEPSVPNTTKSEVTNA